MGDDIVFSSILYFIVFNNAFSPLLLAPASFIKKATLPCQKLIMVMRKSQ